MAMTIQEAAYQILVEEGHPLPSREIAKRALERGLVASKSRDPIQSHAQTIEKNIRDGIYNNPKLSFIRDKEGQRVIGLPAWDKGSMAPELSSSSLITVKVSEKSFEEIKIALESGLGKDESEVLSRLIHTGFKALHDQISAGLSTKFAERRKKIDELIMS